MGITNLDKVIFGVAEMESSVRFWTDFGLAPCESPDERARSFRAQDGSTVELRTLDDPALPPAIDDDATMREATFGLDGPDGLAAVAAELSKDREVREDPDGTLHTVDPLGFPIAFRVSRKIPVTAPPIEYNRPGRPDRLNTRGLILKSARPLEMTHTVYMIDDPDTVVPFYVDRLGFIVSDCYPGRGYFMRGGSSNHHHDLFLLNVGGKRGYHHLAFELGSVHELFGGGLNMTRKGWRTALGPGRHPISSCYFWYFDCPSGGAAEYDFDSDAVDERWEPGTFEQTPENFAEWCLAAGMQDSLLYKGIQTAETAEKK